jgi:hypothetical protein
MRSDFPPLAAASGRSDALRRDSEDLASAGVCVGLASIAKAELVDEGEVLVGSNVDHLPRDREVTPGILVIDDRSPVWPHLTTIDRRRR